MGSKKNIPEGWLSYSPLGKRMPGTVIICFKVPLKEEICQTMPMSERFTPSILMHQVPNLAGVIDVTNTPRYYNRLVFVDHEILHEKIQCPGHVVPPAGVVEKFQKAMERMWTAAESAGKLVGVHCTHGINRTGYLVCRYLIECRGLDPDDAIKRFAESRGHGIERQNYLSDLRTLKPAHHSPNAVSHAEFLEMEGQRRAYWKTDSPQIDAEIPRCDHRGRRAHALVPPPPPVVHSRTTLAPLLPLPYAERNLVLARHHDKRPWHHSPLPSSAFVSSQHKHGPSGGSIAKHHNAPAPPYAYGAPYGGGHRSGNSGRQWISPDTYHRVYYNRRSRGANRQMHRH